MFIVHVFIHVKTEHIAEFQTATLANVQNSIKEPGIARFDFLAQADDPARFVLVEVYRTAEDAARHKETPHYLVWREAVAHMMAEPRIGIKYSNLAPGPDGWDSVSSR